MYLEYFHALYKFAYINLNIKCEVYTSDKLYEFKSVNFSIDTGSVFIAKKCIELYLC